MKVTAEHIHINTGFACRLPHLTIEFAIDELEDCHELDYAQCLIGLQVELNLPRRIEKCSSRR